MRLLAGLLAVSGAAWIAVAALLDPAVSVGSLIVIAVLVVVATGLTATIRHRDALPARLVLLWLLCVVATALMTLASAADGWLSIAAALVYGTVAFLLWAVPPLVVFRTVVQFAGPHPDEHLRRRRWMLPVASVAVLVAGFVHSSVLIAEHVRHPEWSAPASVELVYLLPYVIVSATLALLSWLGTRQPDPSPVRVGGAAPQ